jgi:ABC-type sugar transport system ATPase subunit
VEIVKAINMQTEVLILDEPTSSLTVNETRVLFDNLRRSREMTPRDIVGLIAGKELLTGIEK